MSKITVPKLAEFIAEATGFSDSNLRSIARRLREAGLLSQAGQGRGAAAATPKDAALLLLVAAYEVPPLHAVLIGEAVLDCTIRTIFDDDYKPPVFYGSARDHVAGLIATGKDSYYIRVTFVGSSLNVIIDGDEKSIAYDMPEESPARKKLKAKFGGAKGAFTRTYSGEFRGGVLPEISEFLGFKAEADD